MRSGFLKSTMGTDMGNSLSKIMQMKLIYIFIYLYIYILLEYFEIAKLFLDENNDDCI